MKPFWMFFSYFLRLALVLSFLAKPVAQAANSTLPLGTLLHEANPKSGSAVIFLPTVNASRTIEVTRPQHWAVLPGSQLKLTFQHAQQLLPDRSRLKVLWNGQPLQSIALTAANTTATTVSIPLPTGSSFKPRNQLALVVEQHYTNHCEDPTDPSLWTQILPETQLVLNYQPVAGKISLYQFPLPLVDTLGYGANTMHYILPGSPAASDATAAGIVHATLAQASGNKEIFTQVKRQWSTQADTQNVVIVGTPAQNKGIQVYVGGGLPVRLEGDQWVNSQNGAHLASGEGVIVLLPHPKAQGKGVLVVSGNDGQGVLKAAQYLSSVPRPDAFNVGGNGLVVPADWQPAGVAAGNETGGRYIEQDPVSLAQLGHADAHVEKMTAPAQVYNVPIVGKFGLGAGQLLWDLDFSYGPGLNPKFSTLELRLNDRVFGSVPLNNPSGEDHRHISIRVPSDLINNKNQTQNQFVAKFHLMPDKYGFCAGAFEDKAWATLFNTSNFHVEGNAKGNQLPNLGLLSPTGFPYSRSGNLNTMAVMLPSQPTDTVLHSCLGFVGRVGRSTVRNNAIGLEVTLNDGSAAPAAGKDTIVFGLPGFTGDNMPVFWPNFTQKPLQYNFKLNSKALIGLDLNRATTPSLLIQQLDGGAGHALSLVTASDELGYEALAQYLERDTWFSAAAADGLPLAGDFWKLTQTADGPQLNAGLREPHIHNAATETAATAKPQGWLAQTWAAISGFFATLWSWIIWPFHFVFGLLPGILPHWLRWGVSALAELAVVRLVLSFIFRK